MSKETIFVQLSREEGCRRSSSGNFQGRRVGHHRGARAEEQRPEGQLGRNEDSLCQDPRVRQEEQHRLEEEERSSLIFEESIRYLFPQDEMKRV